MTTEQDPQKALEYFWERMYIEPLFPDEDLTLLECERLSNRMCEDHGVKAPLIIRGRGTISRSFDVEITGGPSKRRLFLPFIQLPKGGRRAIDVLHECCHFLKHKYDHECSHHGPVFVRLLIDEIVKYNNEISREWLEEKADFIGLKYCVLDPLKIDKVGCFNGSCTGCMRIHI